MFSKIVAIFAIVASAQAGVVPAYPYASNGLFGSSFHGYAAPAFAHGYAAPALAQSSIISHGYVAPAIAHGYAAAPIVAHAVPAVAHAVDYYSHPKYEFSYGVQDAHTGDHKSQHEVRDGDVVKGSYSLLESDGTTRTVHYSADDHNGFNAVVQKSGHSVHPAPLAHAAPLISASPYAAAHGIYYH